MVIVIVDVKGFVETYLVDLMCTINTSVNRQGIFFTQNLQRFTTVTVTMIFQRPRKYAKELNLCNKLRFSNPYIFATQCQ